MFASSTNISSNAGRKVAINRLACFRRFENVDTEVVVKWFPITFHPGGKNPESRTPAKKKKLDRLAPKHAAILTCRPAERFSEQQRTFCEQVAVNCPSNRSMRVLAMDFRAAIASKEPDGMLHWIRSAARSGIGALVRFAYGLKKDLAAVIAAVETPWSNGQIEGQINRLKAIKRQMYGRAGLGLLRARVLPYPAKAP